MSECAAADARVVYLRERGRLAYFERPASREFWTEHWDLTDLRRRVRGFRSDPLFTPAVRRHLAPGSRVLEGGCGRGQLVNALAQSGYRAVGVDFSGPVVRAVHRAVPELAVLEGDVRRLPFSDACFDGYVSGGVIEHFWEGYEPILAEMARVLRPGGYAFVSFPQMSPLRRWKAWRGRYARAAAEVERFYQFALDAGEVAADLERLGFEPVERRGWDGIKGFKDEMELGRAWLQALYDGRGRGRTRRWLDAALRRFAPHLAFLVVRRA